MASNSHSKMSIVTPNYELQLRNKKGGFRLLFNKAQALLKTLTLVPQQEKPPLQV
ncbi:Uncharacterised protein [Zhongshania aliphaticivorans]|uniref:Uncharacterized protein n=1 Tax=Zhongshania aliphaticivorans TaxID=1470434 RepID=A0A5S9NFN9_9GAMM|nr:Uncharacterised protein [Zhongshania aliphaticivorans]CAA0114731.1 Uncharacterised protein [Zhongshania aliphaticivorans]